MLTGSLFRHLGGCDEGLAKDVVDPDLGDGGSCPSCMMVFCSAMGVSHSLGMARSMKGIQELM